MKYEDIVKLDKQVLLNVYQRNPLAIKKGLGTKIWDYEGREYLDLLGGIAVLPLGHCHPKVLNAITQQAQQLIHTSNLFYTKETVDLAQILVEMGNFDKVFLANSGTEANEGAIKLARKYQWRKGKKDKFKIVSASHSFHGRTYGSLSATDKPVLKEGFDPLLEGFATAEWNNVESVEKAIDEHTAAFIVEPLQGEGGIYPASEEFLKAARSQCDKVGAVLIFDEIQCGLGRLGTFFAYQSFGVVPDIVTLAKGLANGLPIGAFCVNDKVASGFQKGDHGTTFGGNVVCAAAAHATLKEILENNYCARVSEIGTYFREQLLNLQKMFPDYIKDVRGKGLMIGVELTANLADSFQKDCLSRGLILNVTAKNVLRILPSYLITKEEISFAMKIMRECFESFR